MKRLHLVFGFNALVLLSLAAGANVAYAGFVSGTEPISGGEQYSASGFGSDAKGDSLVAWSEQATLGSPDEVKARRHFATGVLGPIFPLSPEETGSDSPALAMTPQGRAFVAWRWAPDDMSPGSAKGRWVEADGTLGPLLTLVNGSAGIIDVTTLQVVISPTGVASVAYENGVDNKLSVRRVNSDSTLGADIPDISGGSVTNPRVVGLPSGGLVAVWRSSGIEKNTLAADGTIGVPAQISSNNTTGDVNIAVDSLGNSLAIWREGFGPYSVRGRNLDPSGEPAGPERIIDPSAAGFVGSQSRVTADSEGNFLAAWNRQDGDGDALATVREIDSNGNFGGPAQPLSADELNAGVQQAALDDFGNAAAVWDSSNGVSRTTMGRPLDSAGAPIGDITTLFGNGNGDVRVSNVPAAGYAAFLVRYATSGSAAASVVQRFMIPPNCSDSSATITQGRPLQVPLSCKGPGIESAQTVEPPKHGKLGGFDGGGPAIAFTPTPGYQGDDSFSYKAINDAGSSGVAKISLKINKDTVRPAVTSFRFSQSTKKPASTTAKRKPRKRYYSFALGFSEAATAKVVVEQPQRGVRKGKRCRKRTRGARGKRCTLYRSIGSKSSKSASNSVTITATGKLAKRLAKGGRYRASAVATDPAGNKSKVKRITVKPRKVR